MTDTITIIGTLATIQIASIGGLYLLMKSEFKRLETSIVDTKETLRAEAQTMKAELRKEMADMKAELKTEIREATRIVRP